MILKIKGVNSDELAPFFVLSSSSPGFSLDTIGWTFVRWSDERPLPI